MQSNNEAKASSRDDGRATMASIIEDQLNTGTETATHGTRRFSSSLDEQVKGLESELIRAQATIEKETIDRVSAVKKVHERDSEIEELKEILYEKEAELQRLQGAVQRYQKRTKMKLVEKRKSI